MDSDQIREALENEEQRLSAMRSDLRSSDDLDDAEVGSSGGEINVTDNHPADSASEETQREVTLSMLEQIEAELSDVELALNKLEQGTYGKCEVDSADIEPDRLEALPATRYCKNHAETGSTQSVGSGASPI